MVAPRRGLRDIKTLAGRSGCADSPHNAFIRISLIELEKTRRRRERQNALQVAAEAEARLKELEAEKNELVKKLEKKLAAAETPPEADQQATGFVIRY